MTFYRDFLIDVHCTGNKSELYTVLGLNLTVRKLYLSCTLHSDCILGKHWIVTASELYTVHCTVTAAELYTVHCTVTAFVLHIVCIL